MEIKIIQKDRDIANWKVGDVFRYNYCSAKMIILTTNKYMALDLGDSGVYYKTYETINELIEDFSDKGVIKPLRAVLTLTEE